MEYSQKNNGSGYKKEKRYQNTNNYSLAEECEYSKDLYDFIKNEEDLVEINSMFISKELVGKEIEDFDEIADEDSINRDLLRGIINYGYDKPSRPQRIGIRPIVEGRDLLLQSQSGSGKSGAFIIGAIQSIDFSLKKPQVVIISPTGDLADQTLRLCKALSCHIKDFRISYTVGKVDRKQNIKELTDKNEICQLVIATPGRLLDLMTNYNQICKTIKLLIIDEFDELLTGSFVDKMKQIYKNLSLDTQSCFFSATLTKDVLDLSNRIMKNPLKILLKQDDMTLDEIQQTYIFCVSENDKLIVVEDLLKTLEIDQFMIYVNTIDKAKYICEELHLRNYDVEVVHGQMEKPERNEIIRNFKRGEFKCLISTDILARGIDIAHLYLVINYDLPDDPSKYVHRIGRSGRFGKKGLSINLINKNNDQEIKNQTIIKTSFDCKIENFNDFFEKNMNKI